MALNKMSITKANEIIFLFQKILMVQSETLFYPNSLLQFYDLNNAINLQVASDYHYYSTINKDQKAYEKVSQWIKGISGWYFQYPRRFIKDEDYNEIKLLNKNSDEYKKKGQEFADIEIAFFVDVHLQNIESPERFLDYCRSIGYDNKNYWYLVYSKLRVQIDNSDNRLPIKRNQNKTDIKSKKFIGNLELWIYLSLFLYACLFLYFSKFNYYVLNSYWNFTLIIGSYLLTKHFLEKYFFLRETPVRNWEKYYALFITICIVIGLSLATNFVGNIKGFDIEKSLKYLTILIFPSIIGFFEMLKKEQYSTEFEKQEKKEFWKKIEKDSKGNDTPSFDNLKNIRVNI